MDEKSSFYNNSTIFHTCYMLIFHDIYDESKLIHIVADDWVFEEFMRVIDIDLVKKSSRNSGDALRGV